MPFELFTTDKSVPRGEPMATITGYGRFSLNKSATFILEKEKAKHVQLFWDEEGYRVAIKPAEKGKDSFQLAFGTNGNGAGFSCIPFLIYIKYDWTQTRNFAVTWDESEKFFVFSVGKEYIGSVVSGEHLKKQKLKGKGAEGEA